MTQSTHLPLREERDRYLAFAFTHADILVEIDTQGCIAYADGALKMLLNGEAGNITGKPFQFMIKEDERKELEETLERLPEGQRLDSVKVHLHVDGKSPIPCALSGYKLPHMGGRFYATFSVMKDGISAEDLGFRDVKSGLLKEHSFISRASAILKSDDTEEGDFSLTLLHLPELEAIAKSNPERADDLMAMICEQLQSFSLEGDMACLIDDHVYGIMHGDEVSTKEIVNEVKRLATSQDDIDHFTVQSGDMPLSPPGISEQDCAKALKYVINNFYEQEGDNFTLSSLQDGYQKMLDDTMTKIASFQHTVADGAFDVALQPIVHMHDDRLHHFEGLMRFKNEQEAEFSNPFHFITFGEQADIIADFDLAMCQKTLGILSALAKTGLHPKISVNLSGRSLSSDLFRDALMQTLQQHKDVSKQMLFEITESATIDNLPSANQFVQSLRSTGHQCCLDDFGVGASSFDYLRHLEVDFVKIDGSYVKDSHKSERGRHLLKAMVQLCRNMDMRTIGEMVEDESVARFLRECGVQLGQGWHYGKPDTNITQTLARHGFVPKAQRTAEAPTASNMPPRARRIPKTWATNGSPA